MLQRPLKDRQIFYTKLHSETAESAIDDLKKKYLEMPCQIDSNYLNNMLMSQRGISDRDYKYGATTQTVPSVSLTPRYYKDAQARLASSKQSLLLPCCEGA